MHEKDRDSARTEEKASLEAKSSQAKFYCSLLQRLDYKGCLFALKLNPNVKNKIF